MWPFPLFSKADQTDRYGFTSLELERLLGGRQPEEMFNFAILDKTFLVFLKDAPSSSLLNLEQFEKQFHLTFRSSLTFHSYAFLQEVIENCPYFFRFEWLLGGRSQCEASYEEKILHNAFAHCYVAWINPVLCYGLFTAQDIAKHSFIGEYTGIVRKIDKKKPKLNDYCFHYPTKFWSTNYVVIDALKEGNLARFINHSEQPNLQPLWMLNRGILHLIFIANQFIPKGKQLTFDYGEDYWVKRRKE